MRIAFFKALLFSLAVFTSTGFGQGNYSQPNGYIPRYPLGQQGYTPTYQNGYNRNTIQQPQLYRAPAQMQTRLPAPTIPVQRVFTPGVAQSQPYVASNYPYGYQDKPNVKNPLSGSDLPVPTNNRQVEQMPAPRVQQVPPAIQQNLPQQHVQPYQPAQQHNYQPVPQQNYHAAPVYQQQAPIQNHAPIQPIPAGQPTYNAGCNDPVGGYVNNGYAPSGYAVGGYSSENCGSYPAYAPAPVIAPRNMWFGSIGGLVFNRDFEDDKLLAYPFGLPRTKSLLSTDADPGAMGGVEASFGRRFCNGYGIQVNYWGLFSEVGIADASAGNPQTTWQTASLLDYNNGGGAAAVDTYLDAAVSFRARRTNEFHNIELNFLKYSTAVRNYNCNPCGYGGGCGASMAGCGGGGYGCGGGGYGCGGGGYGCGSACGPSCGGGCGDSCGGYGGGGYGCGQPCNSCGSAGGCGCLGANPRPFSFDLLAGVRFFKFDENFFFRTSTAGDYVNNVNDIYYDSDVENNLVGFQVGGNVEYCLFPKWKVVGGTRFGIYGNSISHRQQIYGLAGYAYANTGAYQNQSYDISSTKTDVAFLGQLDLGLEYCINCCWSVGFGYRVISVTGVALAPEQIPYDYSDYADATYIDSNGGLILHGAYARLQYNF